MNIAIDIVMICATVRDIEKPNVSVNIARSTTAGLFGEKPIVWPYASHPSAPEPAHRFAIIEPVIIPAIR